MQFLDNVRSSDQSAPVVIMMNAESYNVPAENARGKTISQLFAEYGVNVGADPARVTNYTLNGEIWPGETPVRPGETWRGSVNSEGKG